MGNFITARYCANSQISYIMAKVTIAAEISNALAAGAILVDSNKFLDKDGNPLKTRNMESTYDPLEVGDTFTIPQDYQVLAIKFNENDDDETPHPFIFVEVHSADGSSRNMRFFPNSLHKFINPVVNGVRQAKVKTTGTACDLYGTKDTIDESLALLKGKTIKVTAAEIYRILTRDKVERDTHIYQYDLAD